MSRSIGIQPLTPVIGSEVHGIDLRQRLSEEIVCTLRNMWNERLVLFFRDQAIDLEQLKAFGSLFGSLHIHPQGDMPGHPGVLKIHTDAHSKVYAGHLWHSDVSCDEQPPSASILYLHQVPECGGDTLFANMYAAYETLSESMRSMLDGLHALHSGRRSYGEYFGQAPEQMRDGRYPEAVHPVVRTHPETGRKALFVNENFTDSIVELSPAESVAVLDFLFRHIADPRFQCRFRWRPNSIAMWDNRCTQHMALWDYYPHTRSGHRVTLQGDRPH